MLALLLIMFTGPAEAIEEAEYQVLRTDGDIELREYAPQIVAEVTVRGSFKEAGNLAFRPLFNYISGDNTSRDEIAMTAPVSMTGESQEIAMTAPVSQQQSGQEWSVSFMMPASFTMETIPVPTNENVVIREIPASRSAVIRYSGTWSEDRYQRHLDELNSWLEANDLEAAGEPVWARYNGPFTPWFMRRNEIIVRVQEKNG
jgi:hypothetical protein